MVLVSNEWQNNSSDDKPTDSASAAATATATETVTSAATTSTISASTIKLTDKNSTVNKETERDVNIDTVATEATTSLASNQERINDSIVTLNDRGTSVNNVKTITLIKDIKVDVAVTLPATVPIALREINIDNGIDNDNTNNAQRRTDKTFFAEEQTLLNENLKKENPTMTGKGKESNLNLNDIGKLLNNKNERGSSTETGYVRLSMESLKMPAFDDDDFVDKILEGDPNAINALNDDADTTCSTLSVDSSRDLTSRLKSPTHCDTVKSTMRSIIGWSNGNNGNICGIPTVGIGIDTTASVGVGVGVGVNGSANSNRIIFNTTNFLIGDSQTIKTDNSSSEVAVSASCNVLSTSVNVGSSTCTAPEGTGQAKIVLLCEPNSHPFQTRTIYLTPNVECMVGRLIAKSKAAENNAIFDCKVLSRKHAVIWYTPDGKFWVRDTKSSNGTFINDHKLGDGDAELHFDDIVKFGVDVLENSRKEVHGCIIACVKLYLPDGRETISIISQSYRSTFGADARISYEDLNRLNLFIKETATREKSLTTKLHTLQNTLDSTRKNSTLCWQAMITEDQLLDRIHTLEKKLQLVEKSASDNVLRNEVIKLMDEKTSYQLKTKEALRKMYQERNNAIQMYTKMQNAYSESNNECLILREQITSSAQTLQDVNNRLIQLESEYTAYKEECLKQQRETKEREEKRIIELTEKLQEREEECRNLKHTLSATRQLQQQQLQQERLLEKQAIEKLDAAIADIELTSDDADGEVNVDIDDENVDGDFLGNNNNSNIISTMDNNVCVAIDPPTEHNKTSVKREMKKMKLTTNSLSKERASPKRINKTTIMKWLQNSDINKKEGCVNIFEAICKENEFNDESDSEDDSSTEEKYEEAFEAYKKIAPSIVTKDVILSSSMAYDNNIDDDKILGKTKCTNLVGNKLKMVQKCIKQLEAEIENETNRIKMAEEHNANDDNEDSGGGVMNVINVATDDDDVSKVPQSNNCKEQMLLSNNNKSYLLLKSGVNMLREAFNDMKIAAKDNYDNIKDSEPGMVDEKEYLWSKENDKTTQISPSSFPQSEHSPQPVVPSARINNEICSICSACCYTRVHDASSVNVLQNQLREYEEEVRVLTEKVQHIELDSEHTLEIIQMECDNANKKVQDLTRIVQRLNEEKLTLENVISQNLMNKRKTAADNKIDQPATQSIGSINQMNNADVYYELNDIDGLQQFQQSHESNQLLQDVNNDALEFEREEELIAYKERLEKQEQANIELRHKIDELQLMEGRKLPRHLVRALIPCGAVALALLIYFLNTYF